MFYSIIESCKYVSKNSTHVKINEDKLDKFADQINNFNISNWLSSSPFGLLELPIQKIINFLLVYESIDFSFWGNPKWSIKIDGRDEDGSIALLYTLLNFVKENNTTDFSNITKEEFMEMLKGNVEIPLLEERYNIIRNVSEVVNEKMNGNFYEYIKHITNDEDLFNIIINNFSSFKDEREYDGKTIYFYKLAQLLTSDILHVREQLENIEVDYSHLIGCADYKIPQVLRSLGILEYSEELESIVDNKTEIFENSKYEVEIRANMLVVLDMIKNKLNNKFYSIDLNDYIFIEAKNKTLKLKPYHLTRNTNY